MISRKDLEDFLHIIEWDLMRLTHDKAFIAMRTAWFLVQVLVFARAITAIVSANLRDVLGMDYYHFYLMGIYVSLLYSISISRGYVIADEFDDGIVEYHLSLPVKRGILVFGRVFGSSLSALLFSLPMMTITYIILGVKNMVSILVSVLAAFMFSCGVVSFVILIVLNIRSIDATDILIGAIDAFAIRLSSIFYPLPVIEAMGLTHYYLAALVNPLTNFVDFLRTLVFPEYTLYKLSPLAMALYVLGLVMGLVILAIEYYERKLEAGGWK
ncbi:MAG: ABC transporter [Desulfurococcaceae archaeon]